MTPCSSTIGATMMISERPNSPRGKKRLMKRPGAKRGSIFLSIAVRHQDVANTANGLQVERQLGVFLDLAAKTCHLHIDGTLQRHAQAGAKIAAGKRLSRIGGEKLQQRRFRTGEFHR